MRVGVSVELDAALRSAKAGELAELLDHLRAAWAKVRSPSLAVLVERVSVPLADERPALSFAKRRALERAWMQRAAKADAIELACLLPSVADASSAVVIERLGVLAALGPDPRLASTCARLLIEAPFSSTAVAEFWRAVQELLVANADPRIVPILAAEGVGYDGPLHRRRARAIAALELALNHTQVALEGDELASLARLEAEVDGILAARPRTGTELLAAILADPHELGHRQVYADYLLAGGDPRGEFIALQLADDRGELDHAGGKRMRALLREYQHAWLGPLAAVVTRAKVVFARGFPTEVCCRVWPARPERTAHDPTWATVERIDRAPFELLRPDPMRSLRAIGCEVWTGMKLLERPEPWPQIQSLVIEVRLTERGQVEPHGGPPPRLSDGLEHGTGLPGLRHLGFHFERSPDLPDLRWLFAGPAGRRLATMEIGLPVMGSFSPRRWQALLRDSGATLDSVSFIEEGVAFWRIDREGGPAPWSRIELRQTSRRELRRLGYLLTDLANYDDIELSVVGELRSATDALLRQALARHGIR